MEVQINGDKRTIEPGQSVGGLLSDLDIDAESVVVELNGRILTSEMYADESIPADATVEIVHFVGGG